LLPVRVQVECSDKEKGHISAASGKSQMNFLNYLHLAHPKVDIRGSQIAIHFIFNPETKVDSTIVFNFHDGRWRTVVEEPIQAVKEALEWGNQNGSERDPFYIQAVFLTTALRWWNNALSSFNDQLIAYVCHRSGPL
jgi:acyl carrier protein phosphodiesterase